MKKITLTISVLCLSLFVFAQDLTTKKGVSILPTTGDWAIGFDGSPLFNYFGNAFNNSTGNSFSVNFLDSHQTIYGKYFTDDNTAYRAQIRIGFGGDTGVNEVSDASAGAAVDAVVENKMTDSERNIILGGGIEKRKGNTRLQGVYGGEGMIGFGGSSTSYTYGNDITDEVPFGGNRTIKSKNGGTFMLGARAFIGAEYFICPKVSVAVEYGWALVFESTGYGTTTVEQYDGTVVEEVETSGGSKSSSFGVDTDNTQGSIRLMLHF